MSEAAESCGQHLLSELNRMGHSFDLHEFILAHDYAPPLVTEQAEELFSRLCGRAAEDGVVTDRERQNLERVGKALDITGDRFERLYEEGVQHVFVKELERAQADGEITHEELISLEQVRNALGLSSVGWFYEDQAEMESRRCTACDAELTTGSDTCPQCGWKDLILDAPSQPVDALKAEQEEPEPEEVRSLRADEVRKQLMICVGISLAVVVIFGLVQTQLDGPKFLTYYCGLGIVALAIVVLTFREKSALRWYILILSVVVYELVGVIRLNYGYSHGMSRFDNLYALMFLGPLTPFIMLAKSGGRSGFSSGGCSGSSCGSSCGGGGGCGGGGCGGCS